MQSLMCSRLQTIKQAVKVEQMDVTVVIPFLIKIIS